jgi:hypothetical protein
MPTSSELFFFSIPKMETAYSLWNVSCIEHVSTELTSQSAISINIGSLYCQLMRSNFPGVIWVSEALSVGKGGGKLFKKLNKFFDTILLIYPANSRCNKTV